MAARRDYPFTPDYAVPPGDTLSEVMESLGMSQAELASRAGRPLKTINEIIKGKAAITSETAIQLERVLGVPASFWMNLERNFREALARQEERQRLESHKEWLVKFPVRVMARRGWLKAAKDPVEQLQELLSFFGVASPKEWDVLWGAPQVAYRKSTVFESDPGAVSVWLRRGEVMARAVPCGPYDAVRFREALREARGFTREPPERFQPEIIRRCAQAGVAVVFVPELPKVRVSGATRWLSPAKALIQLSLRHKSDDHLWFSFFHEAGHILLHGKKEVFIEDDGAGDAKEAEANDFAANTLIPAMIFRRLRGADVRSKAAIRHFADELGIAPGIVVGRLQHEGLLPHTHCNDLKKRFEWAET